MLQGADSSYILEKLEGFSTATNPVRGQLLPSYAGQDDVQ